MQWLGEIPGHWEMSKISSHFRQRNEKVSDKDYPALSVSKQGVTPQLDNVALSNAEGTSRKLVKVGDYAVNSRSDRKGSCGVSKYEGSVSLITIVLEPFNINGEYVHYLFRSNPWVEEFYRNGRGIVADLWTTNYQMMKSMYMPVPPLSEQRSIVSFLDAKCGKIDEWVTKKQKEVEHLQELKQRVIADAVTRGLNPHVKMKATNIPWLKEIPGHWGCVFINRLFNIKAGGDVKPELYADKKDENHPFPVYTNTKSADDVYAYTSLATCPSNSITVTGRGEVGHAFFRETPYDAIVRLLSLTPKSNIICKFYAYFIDTVIPFSSDSAAIGQLSAVQIKQKHVILPPLSEQKQIVSYLDAKCSKIDKLIANITKEIECIKEYKQRLISDVVTGQIKVC